MNIIFLSNFCKRNGSIELCRGRTILWGGASLVSLVALMLWAGYEMGFNASSRDHTASASAAVRSILAEERDAIEGVRQDTEANMDALALRIADLQARLMRLDAVGERLVDMGKLDAEEFNFSESPALGGLDSSDSGSSQTAKELTQQIKHLTQLLSDRDQLLTQLEDLLLDQQLLSEILPSGRPLKKGWMSSKYGRRTDPFTGKKTYHHGIDFAGKMGSEVIAVASGIVIKSEKAPGYGNLIEIRHTGGYTSRYAHNQKNLVSVGDMVEKGQQIALLGSTGRSNGPHVHFEVKKDGRTVDPRRIVTKG